MVDPRDPGTIALAFPMRPRRGRPPTGKAKTAAERMRAYRKRHVVVSTDVLRTVVAQCTQIQQLMDVNRSLRQELDVLYREIARLRDALSSEPG
jgi:phage FluMu protein gp41